MKKLLLFILSLSVMTSCYTTWTTVGNYDQLKKQGLKSYKYDKKKQFYLFEIIPLGHSHAKTPNEPCEVVSKFKLFDFILPTITCGIVGSRTVFVYALEGGYNHELDKPVLVQKEEKPIKTEVEKKESKAVVEVEDEVATPSKNQVSRTETVESTPSVVINQDLKVGDRVVYKLRGQWWYYATITAVSGNKVVLELQNGVTTEKALNDVMKVQTLN